MTAAPVVSTQDRQALAARLTRQAADLEAQAEALRTAAALVLRGGELLEHLRAVALYSSDMVGGPTAYASRVLTPDELRPRRKEGQPCALSS